MREGDAEPDEIAIIPDAAPKPVKDEAHSPTPGGKPIPKTVVEETEDSIGSKVHAEVEKKHRADPPPDLVLKADEDAAVGGGSGASGTDI